MSSMPRLSKSGIEYVDYAWGIFSGCRNQEVGVCPVPKCWAKTITQRFKSHYPSGFEPHIYPEALLSPLHLKKPARIAVGWVGDLIGYADPERWVSYSGQTKLADMRVSGPFREMLFATIRQCPHLDFLFLTKNPEKLPLWSPFPDNAWVGVTACNAVDALRANEHLAKVEAKTKWLSIEPMFYWLLSSETLKGILCDYKLVVIGAQTRPALLPPVAQVRAIVEACDNLGIPVWLKNSLLPIVQVPGDLECAHPLMTYRKWALHPKLRQELPANGIRMKMRII